MTMANSPTNTCPCGNPAKYAVEDPAGTGRWITYCDACATPEVVAAGEQARLEVEETLGAALSSAFHKRVGIEAARRARLWYCAECDVGLEWAAGADDPPTPNCPACREPMREEPT